MSFYRNHFYKSHKLNKKILLSTIPGRTAVIPQRFFMVIFKRLLLTLACFLMFLFFNSVELGPQQAPETPPNSTATPWCAAEICSVIDYLKTQPLLSRTLAEQKLSVSIRNFLSHPRLQLDHSYDVLSLFSIIAPKSHLKPQIPQTSPKRPLNGVFKVLMSP